jgi:hypothetical protein
MGRLLPALLLACAACAQPSGFANRRPVPREHPRLFGSREELRALARSKPETYRRVLGVALEREGGDHE